jgi:hypothetical protein
MGRILLIFLAAITIHAGSHAQQVKPATPVGALPSHQQLNWVLSPVNLSLDQGKGQSTWRPGKKNTEFSFFKGEFRVFCRLNSLIVPARNHSLLPGAARLWTMDGGLKIIF